MVPKVHVAGYLLGKTTINKEKRVPVQRPQGTVHDKMGDEETKKVEDCNLFRSLWLQARTITRAEIEVESRAVLSPAGVVA